MPGKYSMEELWEIDGGYNCMDDDDTRKLVCTALSHVPTEVANEVFGNCLFLMMGEDMRGRLLKKEYIAGKSLIVLGDCILSDKDGGIHTTLHEIAHYMLDHGKADQWPWTSTDIDSVNREEGDADRLADSWLRNE